MSGVEVEIDSPRRPPDGVDVGDFDGVAVVVGVADAPPATVLVVVSWQVPTWPLKFWAHCVAVVEIFAVIVSAPFSPACTAIDITARPSGPVFALMLDARPSADVPPTI